MGSGSLPTQNLPTRLVVDRRRSGAPADELARHLRRHRPADLHARLRRNACSIDPRTVLDGEEPSWSMRLVDALGTARITAACPAPQINITLGTAGHIDHGKTALVKLLTGCDTDRLKDEKERGISIELGIRSVPVADLRGRHRGRAGPRELRQDDGGRRQRHGRRACSSWRPTTA